MIINCSSCQKKFEIIDEELDIKRRLTCPHCLELFEVTWLYPFTMDFIEENPHNPKRLIVSIAN